MQTRLSFFILLPLISFASVNAVLFTPALPDITHFFAIKASLAQQTITWFLIGYALGQLVYSPMANRYGRKPALYVGIGLQIISSLACVLAGVLHVFWLLVIARFLQALGSGVGLKMSYTLLNDCYEPKVAGQKISYLMLAFAITPGFKRCHRWFFKCIFRLGKLFLRQRNLRNNFIVLSNTFTRNFKNSRFTRL
jgi:DHA1 family bicyclomycin/chloramphenicol resistance-like MFS transporter